MTFTNLFSRESAPKEEPNLQENLPADSTENNPTEEQPAAEAEEPAAEAEATEPVAAETEESVPEEAAAENDPQVQVYEQLLTCQQNLRDEKQKTEQLEMQIAELREQLRITKAQADEPKVQQNIVLQEELDKLLSDKLAPLAEAHKDALRQLDAYTEKYDSIVSHVQEDRYRKDKAKMITRLIRMRGLIKDITEEYQNDKMEGAETPAALFLQKQLEALVVGLDNDLQQEMVYKIAEAQEGSEFNPDHQEAAGTQPTEDPEKAGKVYKSLSPAYYWTLPYIFKARVNENGETIHSYKFVLTYEQVITYQLTK